MNKHLHMVHRAPRLSEPVPTFSSVLAGRGRKPAWGRAEFRIWKELRSSGSWNRVEGSSEKETAEGRVWNALNRGKGW